MRRTLAAVVLTAGMLAAAGCSEGGGSSTDDVCDDINETVLPLEEQLGSAMQAAGMAAATGDEAGLTDAMVDLNQLVGQVTDKVREGADEASDDEFREALRTFADEMENLTSAIATGELPDLAPFESASDRVAGYCEEA